jgi:hypothetical protein
MEEESSDSDIYGERSIEVAVGLRIDGKVLLVAFHFARQNKDHCGGHLIP